MEIVISLFIGAFMITAGICAIAWYKKECNSEGENKK